MNSLWDYIFYTTMVCLIIEFILGKLKLMSLIWLYHTQKKTEPTTGISVVICSRNEMKNLQENLPKILNQQYKTFEVIVVDDASEDGSYEFLTELAKEYSHLKISRIPAKTSPGKKLALQKGIEEATYPHLLLTDADCYPNSNQWIQSQARLFEDNKTVVLGYGKHKKTKSLFNKLVRFDTAIIASEYMSRALWKYPYMGVGRNMGFTKDLASKHREINQDIASGDDDLFIQAISDDAVFKVNAEPESFTISEPKHSLSSWLHQKSRHSTTGFAYTFGTKFYIMIKWLAGFLLYAGTFTILLTNHYMQGFIILLLHTLSLLLFNGLWMKKLSEKDLILFIPILNFIYIFVQPVFVLKSMGRNKREWS